MRDFDLGRRVYQGQQRDAQEMRTTYVVDWAKWREEGSQGILGDEWRVLTYKDLLNRWLKVRR